MKKLPLAIPIAALTFVAGLASVARLTRPPARLQQVRGDYSIFIFPELYGPRHATAHRARGPLQLLPSPLLDDLERRAKERPDAGARELAAYGNVLMARDGFTYDFVACDFVKDGQHGEASLGRERLLKRRLKTTDGKSIALEIPYEGNVNSMCGECFLHVAALQVTDKEMVAVVGGEKYKIERPHTFVLDVAELVDESLRRVIRTWQLPHQTIPAGVSPDGTKLYLRLSWGGELDALMLELAEDGTMRFTARGDTELSGEGEYIRDHPEDTTKVYLSFMRFSVGGRSHIVKFSAPCT